MTPPKTLRCLIVDDEKLARARLLEMLLAFPSLHVVGECESGGQAVKAIVDVRPDLVFLDVQMPGLDGFDVLRCTRNAHRPLVIFVTAFDEHAIRAFEVHAVDYLLKPVTRARLSEAVRRVEERMAATDGTENERHLDEMLQTMPPMSTAFTTIPVKTEDGTRLVNAADVLWVEADGDYVRLHERGRVHLVRETLAEMEHRLRSLNFIRVHRSAIVNVTAIASVESIAKGDYFLMLSNGTKVRTSRHYRRTIQALLK